MSEEAEPAEVVVDARGRRCPLPVIDLAKVAAGLAEGAVVTVVADDPAAGVDIPAWCRLRGHDFLGEQPADSPAANAYRVRIRGEGQARTTR